MQAFDVQQASLGPYADLNPQGALALIRSQQGSPDFVVLDVRTQDEFEEVHIAGAQVIDIYGFDFESRLRSLSRSRNYLVYCRTGSRSAFAVALMRDLGFAEAHNLSGGIRAWLQLGLPLESD